MRFFAITHHFRWMLLSSLVLLSCRFDSTHLQQYQCTSNDLCENGYVCCQGYCVQQDTCPSDGGLDWGNAELDLGFKPDTIDPRFDQDLDGVPDEKDNCPHNYNPEQGDIDKDGLGDVCDCAPDNANFKEAVLEIDDFSVATPFPFSPVENAGDWKIISKAYKQIATDGLHRSASTLPDQKGFIATATLNLNEGGDDGLTTPANNLNMAGVLVRTGQMVSMAGSGYYCGIDRVSGRLLLGKTTGDDLEKGQIHFFLSPSDPLGDPGMKISGGISFNTSYEITLQADGTQLLCRVLLPNRSYIEFTQNDTDDSRLLAGGFALFSLGATASFEKVKVCAHK